jgi:predicted RNA-binding protein Jag
MSDKIEIQGKTVEAAVSEALLQLGARRDEVEIKVLEEPKSGFMGFLGGRAARVLVRKKRSRGRGGSGRDHRVEDDSYKAHNLGGRGRSRGGSRSRPSGGSSGDSTGGRNNGRQASREPNSEGGREEKTGTRRGSRGRGGRGRSQGQRQDQRGDQRQDQPRGQQQDQQQDQRRDQKQGQRRDQQQGQQRDQQQGQQRDQQQGQQRDQQQDQRRASGSRNRRGMPRDNRGPEVQSQPAGNTREDSASREETPIRPLRQEPVNTPEIQEVQNVQVATPVSAEPKPIEKKEEVTVTTPKKPRRGFGGLGARIKERKLEAKATAAAEEAKANPPAETESPAPAERPAVSYDSPAASYDNPAPRRSMREERAPSYASARSDEEVILSGIKGVKYAKSIGLVTDENLDDALTELTDGMLARAGFPCRCETHPGEYRQIKVTTDDASAGMLIGRHGQAIDAVEHLVERMASNAIDARARINLDINNYRQEREESLAERVAEASATISESGRAFHMEPMSARERRLVHMEAANLGGLRTFTMDGSGGKHVVITQDDEAADGAEDMENSDA